MSLALTALRLQAIEALRSHPVIAAACPGRVFDSRIADFEGTEPVPTIVVTTEEMEGEAWNEQNGGAPFDERCDLCIEIGMTQFIEQESDAFLFRPETDKEQEAALNLLADCADNILTRGRPAPRAAMTAPGRLLLQAVTRRVSKRTVSRFASDQTGEKLAIHLVTYRVEVKGEDLDGGSPPTGPFADLPDPLRTVAEHMPESSSGHLTCRMLAKQLALVPVAASRLAPGAPPIAPASAAGALPVSIVAPFSQGT